MQPWQSHFADTFPELVVEWPANPGPAPRVARVSESVADLLGTDPDWLATSDGVDWMVGRYREWPARSVAMAYAGHQFGHFNPRLGDGRAVLVGEVATAVGLRDVHLKGSGRTPFSRGGDGKAVLGPMLRELVVSESLAALGVPTTRTLAVVETGESVWRDGDQPGAMLVRVAAGHVRVGTFEFAVRSGVEGLVGRLAEWSLRRFYPDASVGAADGVAATLLHAVVSSQAQLIGSWMALGFVHGVMNTDNMSVSGESIDFGPCAWLDRYHPAAVFSSIDHQGRYAFGRQPLIGQWNLARLAETLLGELSDDPDTAVALATELLDEYPAQVEAAWQGQMAAKLAIPAAAATDSGAEPIIEAWLRVLHDSGNEYTASFHHFAAIVRQVADRSADGLPPDGLHPDAVRSAVAAAADGDPAARALVDPASFDDLWPRWLAAVTADGHPLAQVADQIDRANPWYVPRNHLVDRALRDAEAGEWDAFDRLLAAVASPWERRVGWADQESVAPAGFAAGFRTFCGT